MILTFEDGSTEERDDDSPARFIPSGTIARLSKLRDAPFVYIERDGQWVKAVPETWEQEAQRLRVERDAAIGKANALAATVTKEDIDKAVARAAQAAELRLFTEWAESHLTASGWVRHDAGWILPSDRDMLGALSAVDAVAEQVKRERWRRETAEKRLADLRLWATQEGTAALDDREDVLAEIVRRIDGKVE